MCLELRPHEREHSVPIFGGIWEVTYTEAPPEIRVADFGMDLAMAAALFTKSLDWSNEKEWRAVMFEGGKSYKYSPSLLAAVHMGLFSTEEDVKAVGDCLLHRNIPIYKTWLPSTGYDLESELLFES